MGYLGLPVGRLVNYSDSPASRSTESHPRV